MPEERDCAGDFGYPFSNLPLRCDEKWEEHIVLFQEFKHRGLGVQILLPRPAAISMLTVWNGNELVRNTHSVECLMQPQRVLIRNR